MISVNCWVASQMLGQPEKPWVCCRVCHDILFGICGLCAAIKKGIFTLTKKGTSWRCFHPPSLISIILCNNLLTQQQLWYQIPSPLKPTQGSFSFSTWRGVAGSSTASTRHLEGLCPAPIFQAFPPTLGEKWKQKADPKHDEFLLSFFPLTSVRA